MENVLGCILIGAISFPVSFYLARACLSVVVRLIVGVEPPRGMEVDVLRKAA